MKKKKPLLNVLLTELREQISIVEPHDDSEMDCIAQKNALDLLDYLVLHSEGKADLRRICKIYFDHKVEPSSGRCIDDI